MPKLITVAHTKGGVGKSTLAWNIATALLSRGHSVQILDLDYQKTLFWVEELRKNDPIEPLEAIGVRTISSVAELEGALSSATSDYVVVDVGGFDSQLNRAAISAADVVVCPIRDNIQEVLGFSAFAAVLSSIGTPAVHLLINGAHPRSNGFDDLVEAAKVYPAATWLSTRLCFRAAFARAMARGRGVVEYDTAYYAKAAAEVEALANELLELLEAKSGKR